MIRLCKTHRLPLAVSRAAILALLTAALIACASAQPQKHSSEMKIEVLGFADCPTTAPLRERVEQAVRQGRLDATVAYVDQEALPERDVRRGWPAPTILVNGRDLFDLPAPTSAALGCRIYPGGLPSVAVIAERLKE